MSIYISASLLEDYIACTRRPFYRLNRSDTSIQDRDMITGEVVHKAIELYWNNKSAANDHVAKDLGLRLSGDRNALDHAITCVDTFFTHFAEYCTDTDEVESRFKIQLPWDKQVFVVGKIDRIAGEKLFDWKTTRKPPKSVAKNIQFILYNWAYNKTHGKRPFASYYGALSTGELILHRYDAVLEDIVVHELIPQVVSDIRNKNYLRSGMFRGACYKCQYSDVCLKEIKWDG